ncbi:MAG: NADH-quinone oxidoreductase subunit J [Actinomycetaceae bacterium]|nr:NADH-quinone oxidoreductase subunit J [Actinomycetaceae bacterium]MDY6082694.1 NADH-quinone oxidoreductase subunit J [Actinomycetaceae bacterium]
MVAQAALHIGVGEAIMFFVLAVAMVVLAIYGLLITRRAVYSSACVIAVMVGLAFLYTALEAPFLGVVQVAVYTGAILMMFLFVLMMIGIDSSDSTHETIKGQRWVAGIGFVGIALIMAGIVLRTTHVWKDNQYPLGLAAANGTSNPETIARSIFGEHLLTMELTGTLLVLAALGAMTLTHKARVRKKLSQFELSEAKMQAYAERGRHIGQQPATGVYAESNSAANPALTVGGEPLDDSVPRSLRIRGQARTLAEVSPVTAARSAAGLLDDAPARSGLRGMPGEAAPDWGSARSAGSISQASRLSSLDSAQAEGLPGANKSSDTSSDTNNASTGAGGTTKAGEKNAHNDRDKGEA